MMKVGCISNVKIHLDRLSKKKHYAAQFIRKIQETSIPIRSDFVPFVNERNSIGKLIRESSASKSHKSISNAQCKSVSIRKQRLLNSKSRESFPSVGMYFQPTSWIKQSFSNRKATPTRSSSTMKSEETRHQHSQSCDKSPPRKVRAYTKIKQLRNPSPSTDWHTPEGQIQLRQKQNFCSLKIVGSPREIEKALNFDHIKRAADDISQKIKIQFKKLKYQGCEHLIN